MFKEIAASFDKIVYVQKSVKEGQKLSYHATTPATYEAINSRKWDVIVLQEQSNLPAQTVTKINELSLPYAQQLVDSIRHNSECTKILLYMTWAYKNGNDHWSIISTYPTMQERISDTYLRYADILHAEIAPVGKVWSVVRKKYPELTLYYKDGRHPSRLGSYLAACTFFATVFGQSPYGASYTDKLKPFSAEKVQLASSQVVLNNLHKWRINYNNHPTQSGFDMAIKGNKVRVFNRAKNAYHVSWKFSDETTSNEQNPTHKFRKNGNYTITQVVIGKCKTKFLERSVEIE